MVPELNIVGSPPDLRIRGGVSWSSNASALGLFVNYVDDYKDIQSLAGPQKVDAWTTIDASYRYDLGSNSPSGFLSGTILTLSVLNVFDSDPPAIGLTVVPGVGTRQVPYDTANADPQGRMLGLQISKTW